MWGYKGELRSNVGVQRRKSKVEQSKDLRSAPLSLPPPVVHMGAHCASSDQWLKLMLHHCSHCLYLAHGSRHGKLSVTSCLWVRHQAGVEPSAFRRFVIVKWWSCWYHFYAIGLHRSDQAMPYGWLMPYRSAQELMKTSLRGDKSPIAKVGTRCEEAEVWRSSWQKYMWMWSISKCMVNVLHFGLFDWVPACCTVYVLGMLGQVLAILCLMVCPALIETWWFCLKYCTDLPKSAGVYVYLLM